MLRPPIEPMLAKPLGSTIPPASPEVSFEPKWDGFRCLVFRSVEGVVLQGRGRSRDSADEVVDLAYAFPEIVKAVAAQMAPGLVVDGEIVLPHEGRLDFGVLSSRLRPRSEAGGANIARLAAAHPAMLLLFDVLWSGHDVQDKPLAERRQLLESLAAGWRAPILLTPTTGDPAVAARWFADFEAAGVDGLIVKDRTAPYTPGMRTQGKVKHERTADVVVAGWRPHARPGADGQPVVGSLLLGLHDQAGTLHYVGASSAFTAATRAALVDLLEPHSVGEGQPHPWRGATTARVPGEASRWKREQAWTAVRPALVAEVGYDQMEGERFRHVAKFVRWRPDRAAASCAFDQLEVPPLARIIDLIG
jgi:ATP-dependent DNA ligase